MCRIGGSCFWLLHAYITEKLPTQVSQLNFFEIPLLKVFSANSLKHCIAGSLTGAVTS